MNRGVRIQLSLALSGIFLLILGACGRSGDSMQVPKDNPDAFTGGGGADISATGCEEITAYKKIQPILARRCTGCHHTFEKEPEQFLNRAKGGKNSNIYKFVFEKTPMEMPRAGSSQAAATTDAEREQIAEFVLGLEKDCNESKGVVASGTAQPQGIEVSAGSSQQQEKKALAIQDILNPEMKTVLTTCTGCHGSYGVASDPEAPHLAGQNAEYIVSQLEQFALPVEDSSHRPGGVMNFMVSSLTPENRESIAAYFSFFQWNNGGDKEMLTPPSATLCLGCHSGASGATPRLQGQKTKYLEKQLKAFRDGERKGTVMNSFAATLSDEDINELAHYFSQQKQVFGQ